MTAEEEVAQPGESHPLIGDGQAERRAIDRWPEQRAVIRSIRARMQGRVTVDDLINRCIVDDVFDAEDLESFLLEGIKRRVLNAVPDMRTGRRG